MIDNKTADALINVVKLYIPDHKHATVLQLLADLADENFNRGHTAGEYNVATVQKLFRCSKHGEV